MNTPAQEPQIVETAQDARQGRLGWPVWLVLVTSTTLVVVAFAVVLLIFAGPADAAGI